MKNEIMIGRLKGRVRILCESFISLGLMFLFYKIIMNILKIWDYFTINPQAYVECEIFMAMIFVLAFLLGFSTYGNKQVIKITYDYFYYCSNIGLFSNYRQVWRILLRKDMNYEVKVKISDIDYISLAYSNIAFRLYYQGHSIIFNIVLKDGVMIKIQPDNLYFEKENCLEGIEYLEKNGVMIRDPYRLKDALKDKNLRFAEYIDRMNDHEHSYYH